MDYAAQYPDDPIPSIWSIDESVRKAELQTRVPKERKRGGSAYLLYPIHLIRKLGYIHQSADFIGKKYIAGRTEPINIFSTSYYAPFKLYQIKRILAETSLYAIKELEALWTTYPIPNVFRIDNGLQFRGTARAKKAIGVFLKFLLNMGVTPLFGSPSKPWTNPHVEGHNRVFNEKVWGRNFFTGLEQIDHECEQFNRESLDLFRFRYSELVFNGSTNGAFRYLGQSQSVNCANLETVRGKKIYFIRFVESFERTKKAHVTILNETVRIPEKFAHQFVFVEWNLEEEWLSIYSEYQGVSTLIEKIKFRPNI